MSELKRGSLLLLVASIVLVSSVVLSGCGSGRIAFQSDRDGNYEIYIMNADGSDQTRLTINPDDDAMFPAWSPDGTRIVFVSSRDGNYEIYVMNADGSDEVRLTDNTDDDMFPAW